MKKLALVLILVLLAGAAFAQSGQDVETFSLDLGPVLSTGYPLGAGAVGGFFAILLYLRGGLYVDFMYNLNDTIHLGAETGLLTMSIESGGVRSFVMDLPVRAFARFTFGSFFVQPQVGTYIPLNYEGIFFDVGGKLGFGKRFKFFLEGSYLIGEGGYPRFGIGGLINIVNF